MYEPLWQAVKETLSGDAAREFTARLWEHARWNSFDRMRGTADEIAAIMREIGLDDVQVLEYPADGVTAYGGWVMPQAWDAQEAVLEIAESAVERPVLARYREVPQSLMMYSAPTPADGLTADVVAVDNAGTAESYDGKDVAGRIVLADGVGLEIGVQAFAHGAAGVVSDAMKLAGSPHEKAPGHFDDACQWHNYTIPPWKTDERGFGFSISPSSGRRLRALLAEGGCVKLRAVVRTRLYDGVVPCVTGALGGETQEEIAITGHLCEPGANDNSSGCALGLEVIRTAKALAGTGRLTLRRGLRAVFSFEVRGYQAFLATWPKLNHLVAGLNLDMVGNDLSDARARSNLVFNYPNLPAYTDALALELMRRLQRDDSLFRFRTASGELVDNLFGIPAVGAPTCVLGNWPDATYHTSLDRIETISASAMATFGRVAGTYCAFLASAGLPQAVWLARLIAAQAEAEMIDAARRGVDAGHDAERIAEGVEYLVEKNAARLRSLRRLVPARHVQATEAGLRKNKDWLCHWSHLFRNEELSRCVEELSERLRTFARRRVRALRSQCRRARRTASAGEARGRREDQPCDAEIDRARRLVPQAAFKGSVCFESLDASARAELKDRTGLGVSWGAPGWLQMAVFAASGKRTALDIWRWLRNETRPPGLERYCRTFEFLARHGFVRLRPCLAKADYVSALKAVSLPRGCVAMVHSSLNDFGYVEGGAETVIGALLDAIGPDGTLAMPTLSCSWVGRPPFDREQTPSRVGAITEAFRRRSGVLRSAHPTHSVAALGPHAETIVAHHTPERPVFAPESPFGRLYELDAWILMLCKRASNTTLHMAEERVGLLRTDLVAHVMDGRRRREVTVVHAPCHANFERHYEVLSDRDLLRTAPLGEKHIHLMRCRDAVDAAVENLRADPLLVTGRDCDCEFCRNVRAHLAEKESGAP